MEVIIRLKTVYQTWQISVSHIPKIHRYTFGSKIDTLFLEALEFLFRAQYSKPELKVKLLIASIGKIDLLNFFLQIGWENKLIDHKKYSELSENLQEIGKMLGGWKRRMENKTPQK